MIELEDARDADGVMWPFGSRADHLSTFARIRLFRFDRTTRLRALAGLQYWDLAADCRHVWQLTRRPRFLVGLVAAVASTVAMTVCSAMLGLSLALAWFGQPVRLWIALGFLSSIVGAVTCAVAEAFAPTRADVDTGVLGRIR